MRNFESRGHQLFTVWSPAQIETARRFASGPETAFAPGSTVYAIEATVEPAWLVLRGKVEVVRRIDPEVLLRGYSLMVR